MSDLEAVSVKWDALLGAVDQDLSAQSPTRISSQRSDTRVRARERLDRGGGMSCQAAIPRC